MSFYESIAKYYDFIFPAGRAQLDFLAASAGSPPKSVLDIACGTGNYSVELGKLGYSVTAVDLDGQMIESLKAKRKAGGLEGKIQAVQGNMLELKQLLSSTYDLAFCIGNSLVHLEGKEEIEKFLSEVKNLLVSNGHLAIQIINYDRILEKNIDSLPTIEVEEQNLRFHRLYHYDRSTNKVLFKTTLEVNGAVLENEIPLYPLRADELEALLWKAGFTTVEMFGDFKKNEFQKDKSYSLVVSAS